MKRMRLTGPDPVAAAAPFSTAQDVPAASGELALPGHPPAGVELAEADPWAGSRHDWLSRGGPLSQVLRYLPLRDRLSLAAVNHVFRALFVPHLGLDLVHAAQVGSLSRLRIVIAGMPAARACNGEVLCALVGRLAWLPWADAVAGWHAILAATSSRLAAPRSRIPVLRALGTQIHRTLAAWAIPAASRRAATLPFDPSHVPDRPRPDAALQACEQCLSALTAQAAMLGDRGASVMLSVQEAVAFLIGSGMPPTQAASHASELSAWLDAAYRLDNAEQRQALDTILARFLLSDGAEASRQRADAVCHAALDAVAHRQPGQRALMLQALAIDNPCAESAPISLTSSPRLWWQRLLDEARRLPASEASAFAIAVARHGIGDDDVAPSLWDGVGPERFSRHRRAELQIALAGRMSADFRQRAWDLLIDCCVQEGLNESRRQQLDVLLVARLVSVPTSRSDSWFSVQADVQRVAAEVAQTHPDLAAALLCALAERINVYGYCAAGALYVPVSTADIAVGLLQRVEELPPSALHNAAIAALLPWLTEAFWQDWLPSKFAGVDAAVRLSWLARLLDTGHVTTQTVTWTVDALREVRTLPRGHAIRSAAMAPMSAAMQAIVARASVHTAGPLARLLEDLPDVIDPIDLASAPALAQGLCALALSARLCTAAAIYASSPLAGNLLGALAIGGSRILDMLRGLPLEMRQDVLLWLVQRDNSKDMLRHYPRLTNTFIQGQLGTLPPLFRVPVLLVCVQRWTRGQVPWRNVSPLWDAIVAVPQSERSALLAATSAWFTQKPVLGLDEAESWEVAKALWQTELTAPPSPPIP